MAVNDLHVNFDFSYSVEVVQIVCNMQSDLPYLTFTVSITAPR